MQSAMDEELELTTDGCDIYITRKTEPYVICAISLTSAAVKSDGEYQLHCIYLSSSLFALSKLNQRCELVSQVCVEI